MRRLPLAALLMLVLSACVDEAQETLDNFSVSSGGSNPAAVASGTVTIGATSRTVSSATLVASGNGVVMDFQDAQGNGILLLSLPNRSGTITMTTSGGAGVSKTDGSGTAYVYSPSFQYGDITGSVTVSEATISPKTSDAGTVRYTVSLSGASSMIGGTARALSGTVSLSFDNRNSTAGSSGGGSGGTLNLVCPGSLPSGYQCLSNAGQLAPGKYDIAALHGTWVETSFQVCMTLGSNGSSSFKYKSGFPSTTGQWGALMSKTGQFQPTSGPYYVFTGSTDPQIKLLTFDANTGRFVGWGFAKGSCPW